MTIQTFDFDSYNRFKNQSAQGFGNTFGSGSFNTGSERYSYRIAPPLADPDRPSYGSGKDAAISLFAKIEDRLTSDDPVVRLHEWSALRNIVSQGIIENTRSSFEYKTAIQNNFRRHSIGNLAYDDPQIDAIASWQIARHKTIESAVTAGFGKNAVSNALARYENMELSLINGIPQTPNSQTSPSLAKFLEADENLPSVLNALERLNAATLSITDTATMLPSIIDSQFADPVTDALNVGKELASSDEKAIDENDQFTANSDGNLLTPEQRFSMVKKMLDATRASPVEIQENVNHEFVGANFARSNLLQVLDVHGIVAPERLAVIDGLDRLAFGIPSSASPEISLIVDGIAKSEEFTAYNTAATAYSTELVQKSNLTQQDAHKQFHRDLADGKSDPLSRVDIIARTREEAEIIKRVVIFAASHGATPPSPEKAAAALNAIRADLSRTITARQPSRLLQSTPRHIKTTPSPTSIATQMAAQAAYYTALAKNPDQAPPLPNFSSTVIAGEMHPYWKQYYAGSDVAFKEVDKEGNLIPQSRDKEGNLIFSPRPPIAENKTLQRAIFGAESKIIHFPIHAMDGTTFYKNKAAIGSAINAIALANETPTTTYIDGKKQPALPKTAIIVAEDLSADNARSASRSTAAILDAAEKAGMTRVDLYVVATKGNFRSQDASGQGSTTNEKFLTFLTKDGHEAYKAEGQRYLRGQSVDGKYVQAPKPGTIIVLHPGGDLSKYSEREIRGFLKTALVTLSTEGTMFGVNRQDAHSARTIRDLSETGKNLTIIDDFGRPVAIDAALAIAKVAAPRRREGGRLDNDVYEVNASVGEQKASSLTGRLFLANLVGQKAASHIADTLANLPNGGPTIKALQTLATADLPAFAKSIDGKDGGVSGLPDGHALLFKSNSVATAKIIGGATLDALRDQKKTNMAFNYAYRVADTMIAQKTDYNGEKLENPAYRNALHTVETTGPLVEAAGKPLAMSISPDLNPSERSELTTPKTAIIGSLNQGQKEPTKATLLAIDKAVLAAAKNNVVISTTANEVGAHVILAAEKHGARVFVVGTSPHSETASPKAEAALKDMIRQGKAAYASTNLGVDHDMIQEIASVSYAQHKNIAHDQKALLADTAALNAEKLDKDDPSSLVRRQDLADRRAAIASEIKELAINTHSYGLLVAKAGIEQNPALANVKQFELAVARTNSILVVAAPRDSEVVYVASKAALDSRIDASAGKSVAVIPIPGADNGGTIDLASNSGKVSFRTGRGGGDRNEAAVLFLNADGKPDNSRREKETAVITSTNWMSHGWTRAPATAIIKLAQIQSFLKNSSIESGDSRAKAIESGGLNAAEMRIITGATRMPTESERAQTNDNSGKEPVRDYSQKIWELVSDGSQFGVATTNQSRKQVAAGIGI